MTPIHDVIMQNQENENVEVVVSTSISSSSSSAYDSAKQEPETGTDQEELSNVIQNEPQRPSSASSSSSLTTTSTTTTTPSDHEPEPTTKEEEEEPVKDQPNARSVKKGSLTTLVKKNDPCPCGSALKYKKCCWAKERHAARLRKMKGHDKDTATATEEDESDDEENPVAPMTGDFRAIKI